jgi:toxin FitB
VIIVDTNVISELMRPEPNPKVLAWVAAQPRAQLYTTYINQIEVLYGIAVLPEGRRRDALRTAAEGMFAEDFAGRLLPFGASAAARYAEIMLSRHRVGKPIEGFDALIAAHSACRRSTGGHARHRRILRLRPEHYRSLGSSVRGDASKFRVIGALSFRVARSHGVALRPLLP